MRLDMDNHLRVAYATDTNYLPITGISMYSLLDNNREFEEITIYILDNGISDQGKSELENTVKQFKRDIVFFDCSKLEEWLGSEVAERFHNEWTNVPISAYARLFLTELLPPDAAKIIYLDADSLVLGSFKKLWDIDMNDALLMGVLDNARAKTNLEVGLPEDFRYINSGMTLLNIEKLRQFGFVNKMRNFINKYHGHVYHHDQGILNGVLAEKISVIPPEYNMISFIYEQPDVDKLKLLYNIRNYYSQREVDHAIENPVFVHFTRGFLQRPWVEHCRHPLRQRWTEYRDRTVWKDLPMQKDTRGVMSRALAWTVLNLPVGLTHHIMRIKDVVHD